MRAAVAGPPSPEKPYWQIGRASCRERGEISGVAVSLKKKKKEWVGVLCKYGPLDSAPMYLAHVQDFTCQGYHGKIVRNSRGCLAQGDFIFFFSSRRRHTRLQGDWSSDVCSSDLIQKRHTRLQGDWSSDVCSSE